ncbi:MAG: hypothetical protein HQK49_09415 [Oligoflexia bacterium]|nr:hypothetical protein [Oligoflexia bacterium]
MFFFTIIFFYLGIVMDMGAAVGATLLDGTDLLEFANNNTYLLQTLKWKSNSLGLVQKDQDSKTRVIDIEHYEVPIKLVSDCFEEQANLKLRESIILNKIVFQGSNQIEESFIRWPINPNEKRESEKVKKLLQKNGYDSSSKKYFKGVLTSDGVLFLKDPQNKFIFMITPVDKEEYFRAKESNQSAAKTIRITNLQNDTNKNHLLILRDPFGFHIHNEKDVDPIDLGLLVKDISLLYKTDKYYLPLILTSNKNSRVRYEIAKINSRKNVQRFWNQNYVIPLARTLSEFTLFYGLSFVRTYLLHSYLELDQDKTPTGKIVLGNIGDTIPIAGYSTQDKDKNDKNQIMIGYATVDENIDEVNAKIFFKAFEKRLSELAEIPLFKISLQENIKNFQVNIKRGKYQGVVNKQEKQYLIAKDELQNFIALRECLLEMESKYSKFECRKLLDKMQTEKPLEYYVNSIKDYEYKNSGVVNTIISEGITKVRSSSDYLLLMQCNSGKNKESCRNNRYPIIKQTLVKYFFNFGPSENDIINLYSNHPKMRRVLQEYSKSNKHFASTRSSEYIPIIIQAE